MAREAMLTILIAKPGSGKSFDMVRLSKMNQRNLFLPSNVYDDMFTKQGWKALDPEYILIDDPDDYKENPRKIKQWYIKDMNTFKGTRYINLNVFKSGKDQTSFINSICDPNYTFTNGGLFIDDFKNYIPSKGEIPYNVQKLFRERRHRMIDIFLACHNFQEINQGIISMGCQFVVGPTTLKPYGSAKEKISNWRELLDVVERVNKISRDTSKPENRYYKELFIPNVSE